jgi:hypothetical protein
MPTEAYRYYCLDRAGQLHRAAWFDARDDDDAIAQVKARHQDATCEVWRGDKLIARLPAEEA